MAVVAVKSERAPASARPGLGRLQALLLIAVVAAPLVLAYGIFFTGLGMPVATVNKGQLLQPARSTAPLELRDQQGRELLDTGRKWRLLIPYGRDCGKVCSDNLYTTRQVHIRLGDKARRVERLLLNIGAPIGADAGTELQRQHPRLRISQVLAADFKHWLGGASELPMGQYYLVDQEGFAMMAYGPDHHGNELLTDLKRTLKFSYEE